MAKKTTEEAAATVTVKVLCGALAENGVSYTKGQTFETTAERADALGELVTTKLSED
jgi:hypothetical protein